MTATPIAPSEAPITHKQKYTYDFASGESSTTSTSESSQSDVVIISDPEEETITDFPAPVTEDLLDDTPMPTETYFKALKFADNERANVNVMDGTTTTPIAEERVPATVYSTTAPIKVAHDELRIPSSSESSAELTSSTKAMYAVTEDNVEPEIVPAHHGPIDQSPFLPEGENNDTLLKILQGGHDVEPQNETDEIVNAKDDDVVIAPVVASSLTTTTERVQTTVLPVSEEASTGVIVEASTEEAGDSTEMYKLLESRSHNHDMNSDATITVSSSDEEEIKRDSNEGSGGGDGDPPTYDYKSLSSSSETTLTTSTELNAMAGESISSSEATATSTTTTEAIPVTFNSVELTKSEESGSSKSDEEQFVTESLPTVQSSEEYYNSPVVIFSSAENVQPSTEDSSETLANSDSSKLNNDIYDPEDRFTKANEFYGDGYQKLSDINLRVIPLSKEVKQNETDLAISTSSTETESNAEQSSTENVTGHFLVKPTFHLAQSSSLETSNTSEQNPETLVVKSNSDDESSVQVVKSEGLDAVAVENVAAFSRCTAGQFECLNATSIKDGSSCISLSERCDAVAHCSDNSDEVGCEQLGCPGHFRCNDGPCLARHLVCDKIAHCTDGSDELAEICGK